MLRLSGLSFKLSQFTVDVWTGHHILQWIYYVGILKSITLFFSFFIWSRVFVCLTSVPWDFTMHRNFKSVIISKILCFILWIWTSFLVAGSTTSCICGRRSIPFFYLVPSHRFKTFCCSGWLYLLPFGVLSANVISNESAFSGRSLIKMWNGTWVVTYHSRSLLKMHII